MYLTLMGHFGRQTGYPVFRVSVAGADALKADAPGDFLVIGTGDDQPAFEKLGNNLPVSVRGGKVQVKGHRRLLRPSPSRLVEDSVCGAYRFRRPDCIGHP